MKKYINSFRAFTVLAVMTLAVLAPIKPLSSVGIIYWDSLSYFTGEAFAVDADGVDGETMYKIKVSIAYSYSQNPTGYTIPEFFYCPGHFGSYEYPERSVTAELISMEVNSENLKLPEFVMLTEESIENLLSRITNENFRKTIRSGLIQKVYIESYPHCLAYNKMVKNIFLPREDISIGAYFFVYSAVKNLFIKDGGHRYFNIAAFRGVDLSKVTLYYQRSTNYNYAGKEPYTRFGFKDIIECENIETTWNKVISQQ